MYNAKIGPRKCSRWGYTILVVGACALGGCLTKFPLYMRLSPTEVGVVNATIRLILDESARTYVWKNTGWGRFGASPYELQFGQALEVAAPWAFRRAFTKVEYPQETGVTDATGGDVRTVMLKLLHVDVSPGFFNVSTSEASVRLAATVLSSHGEEVCNVTAEGKGVASPGGTAWLPAGVYIPFLVPVPVLTLAAERHNMAVRAACEKAVGDALEKIVAQTVACW